MRIHKRSSESYEDVELRARCTLSLLAHFAEAQSLADRGGVSRTTEQEAWTAVEMLARSVRDDVVRLKNEIEAFHTAERRA